jgi:hypothetical protein
MIEVKLEAEGDVAAVRDEVELAVSALADRGLTVHRVLLAYGPESNRQHDELVRRPKFEAVEAVEAPVAVAEPKPAAKPKSKKAKK